MRRRIAVAAALLVLSAAARADAKSFSLDRVHCDVVVESDGTARVTESLTYTFDGSFSYAFRSIPLRSGDRIYDVEVSENGSDYARSTSRIAGSYTVEQRGDEVVVTWYYRAHDETRTFDVSYTASGLVERHSDVADYYHTLFSNETGRRVGEVSASVTLPSGVDADALRVFAHGPLWGEVRIESATSVRASVSPLPNGRMFDVRVLTNPDAFARMTAPAPSERPVLDRILAQEREWADEANRQRKLAEERARRYRAEREEQRRLARALLPVSIALSLLALGVWFILFRSHGWPHEVAVHSAPGDIPSDHPPAIVAFLMARNVGGPAMVATLVDLSERGVLSIAETRQTGTNWLGRSTEQLDYRFERARTPQAGPLRPYERSLVEFMVDEVGDGAGFTMSALKSYARKHRTGLRKWFVGWMKAVKVEADEEGLFEPYPVGAMVANAIVGTAVAAAGGVICAVTSSPVGVPAIATGVLSAILTVSLARRTEEGQRLMKSWKQFRRHLESLSRAMGPVTLTSRDWARFLSAAIVFGMYKKVIPKLQLAGDHGAHAYPVWYAALSPHGGGGVGGMADGFSSMIASVSSTVSSASGAGGGASSGGGGGGGGGSAGAG